MPVANVLRVSITGAMPSGEEWSVNPVWQIGGVSTAEDITSDQANTMAIAIAAIAVPTGLVQMNIPNVTVTGARVEARRWDGTLAAQGEAVKAVPTQGTASTGHTFQSAAVFSLRTSGVGPSGRGRVYWPATGVPVGITDLRPTSANVTTYLSAMKTYLTSITSAIDVTTVNGPILSVWSRLNASTLPVTSIQLGNVLDVQRRRRDQLIETYQSTTFP